MWKLDFSMASNEYTLSHQLELSLYQRDGDTVYFKSTCKGENGRKMPMEDWERDDFAAIATASSEVASQCAGQFLSALDTLPVQQAVTPPELSAPAEAGAASTPSN